MIAATKIQTMGEFYATLERCAGAFEWELDDGDIRATPKEMPGEIRQLGDPDDPPTRPKDCVCCPVTAVVLCLTGVFYSADDYDRAAMEIGFPEELAVRVVGQADHPRPSKRTAVRDRLKKKVGLAYVADPDW